MAHAAGNGGAGKDDLEPVELAAVPPQEVLLLLAGTGYIVVVGDSKKDLIRCVPPQPCDGHASRTCSTVVHARPVTWPT